MKFKTALMQSPVRYGLCLSEWDYLATLARIKPIDDERVFLAKGDTACTQTVHIKGGGIRVIVCYRPSKKSIEEIHGDLVHEAVHVWQEIRSHMGESEPGTEQEAYSIEKIATNLFLSYKQQTQRVA
jgi:hypothetical protein